MIKSREPQDMRQLLNQFADACEKSRTVDGDWQGDGWGAAWVENNNWNSLKSLQPMWEDKEKFVEIPKTHMIVAHARSASFPNQKGVLSYNQPYISGKYCFVFNGLLQGVKLQRKVTGDIGAQKIWTLIKEKLDKGNNLTDSLKIIKELLHESSSHIKGLNVGIANFEKFTALCDYGKDKDYFTINYYKSLDLDIICSEKIGEFEWEDMRSGEIYSM